MHARGRSRQISRAAEARKASEERRVMQRRRPAPPAVVVDTEFAAESGRPPSAADSAAKMSGLSAMRSAVPNRPSRRAEDKPALPFASATEAIPTATTTTTSSSVMHDYFSISRMPSLTSDSSPHTAHDSDFGDFLYCDSPPSPPHTIEDQLHVAYAHDDIHLAKILLLKLQGIEVADDDDPRIAAVREEDFDVCFLPHGSLLTEEEEQRAKEAQRAEQEKRDRQLWERRCQRIWDNEKQRLHDEKLRMKLARLKAEEQRKQLELDARQRAVRTRPRKPKLSYSGLSHSRASSSSSTSSLMAQPPLDLPPRRSKAAPVLFAEDFDAPAPCSDVAFDEIISCMNGALFPLERGHSRTDSVKSTSTLKSPGPLDVLLDPDVSRYQPGQRRNHKLLSQPHCLVCRTSSMSSSMSSPVSATSDDSEYSGASLFSSFSSTYTDITTPSSSPDSLVKEVSAAFTRRIPTTCRCRPPPSRLVPAVDHPLTILLPAPTQPFASTSVSPPRRRSRRSPNPSRSTSRFGRFLQLAKGFQHAYMHAMVYSVMPTDYAPQEPKPTRMRRVLHPEGYRATAALVSKFISPPSDDPEAHVTYVSLDAARHTPLPFPLPYRLVFAPDVVPQPSPMQRFFQQTQLRAQGLLDHDPEQDFGQLGRRAFGPKARLRIVQNPLWMQLHAARGAAAERGASLDSPGLKKGPMAGGREKVLSVAMEWNRASRLRN